MKKISYFGLLLLSCWIFLISSTNAFAAEDGTMMSNAVDITYGVTYNKTWLASTDHLNHYCKLSVPEKGTITINATKPYASDGEYGSLLFTLYDEYGDAIWDNNTEKSKNDAKDFYIVNVNLPAGIYYMTISPNFKVITGTLSTSYCYTFKACDNCEIEPNNDSAHATTINLGTTYTGYIGGGKSYEKNDYYKVYLQAGKYYKITRNTLDWYLHIYTPGGEEQQVSNISASIDSDGTYFNLKKITTTGWYYIKEGYSGSQEKYTLCVSEYVKKANTITNVKSSYKISVNTSELWLYPHAELENIMDGYVDVESYDSRIVDIISFGSDGSVKISPKKVGETTLVLKSAENEWYYASSQFQVKIVVTAPSVTLKSVSNKDKGRLLIRWKCSGSSYITGYQYQIALNKNFTKGVKTYKEKKKYSGVYLYKSNGLRKNKVYYVRIRTYCKSNGKTYYSKWSKVKHAKMR